MDKELAKYKRFFKRVADLTLNHKSIGDDVAVVYPSDLGPLLAEIDPYWYRIKKKKGIMPKNAKGQLKAIMEKHKNDAPVRSKQTGLKKPPCTMIPLLDLDDCLSYAIQEKVITEADANVIIEYMKYISDQSGYWDMHWGDIEDEKGILQHRCMKPEQALKFRAFYELFKEHEIRDKTNPPYPHLHFDVGVYS